MAAARKLADALGGELLIPDSDDFTPQTAIVRAAIDGQAIEIDFLWHIKGVNEDSLVRQAVEIEMQVRTARGVCELRIPLMHPLHCLQSRLANVIELGRTSDLARRQLEASPIVLREYLVEVLEMGGHRHVTSTLRALCEFLLTDTNGRKAHQVMANDPAKILERFCLDERLDPRWRELSLGPMRRALAKRSNAE